MGQSPLPPPKHVHLYFFSAPAIAGRPFLKRPVLVFPLCEARVYTSLSPTIRSRSLLLPHPKAPVPATFFPSPDWQLLFFTSHFCFSLSFCPETGPGRSVPPDTRFFFAVDTSLPSLTVIGSCTRWWRNPHLTGLCAFPSLALSCAPPPPPPPLVSLQCIAL